MGRINVLSLFNGMSFGMMALETCGIEVDKYYSSEIDKYANQATKALYPGIIQLGDVTKWREWDIDWSSVDLLLAGFPCQAWSIAGKQKGDNDPRGALVHDLIDIWSEIRKHNTDMKFMFENVKMKKVFLAYINELFGVEPVCINSALVSAQNRVRYYWTNIGEIDQPEDKGIVLSDILEYGIKHKNHIASEKCLERLSRRKYSKPKIMPEKTGTINTANNSGRWCLDSGTTLMPCDDNGIVKPFIAQRPRSNNHLIFQVNDSKESAGKQPYNQNRIYHPSGKSTALTVAFASRTNVGLNNLIYRKLTPRECARLQTVPEFKIDDLLSAGISNTQLYKMLGNGWTHDVIVHIFKGLLV